MKVVILDGFTANPGDLSWDGLKAFGELTVYERTKPEELLERARDAEVLLTNKVIIGAEAMAALPHLRYIGVLATGYNVVDIAEAHKRGIAVTNIPAYSTMSVAQMVMAHLLNITSQVALHAEAVRRGEWEHCKDFSFTLQTQQSSPRPTPIPSPAGRGTDTNSDNVLCDKAICPPPCKEEAGGGSLVELDGLTFGIVGLGNIGKQVARMAQAFGMKVMAVSSKPEEELSRMGIRKASGYEQLFSESDVVSLHCPLTDETRHLVNRERLALMKPSAILINTGRGPLLDEAAVAEALTEGKLYAAGVDVLTEEPPRQGSPLISAPRCFITPHIAWASLAARRRLIDIATSNVAAFLHGKAQNRIS